MNLIPQHNNAAKTISSIVSELEQQFCLTLCFAMKNLQTGTVLQHNPHEPCKSASIIKLPILVHIAMAVYEGELNWYQPILLNEAEKVAGSGVLSQLCAGLELTLKDVCMLMTIVSDNTATNMLIELLGKSVVNQRMRKLGLQKTTLFRKAYSPDNEESKLFGLGVTTPDEMIRLLTLLHSSDHIPAAAAMSVVEFLKRQQCRDSIPRFLSDTWGYAGKTGALDSVRNDVAIVTSPEGVNYALAVFTQDIKEILWTPENAGELAIAHLAHILLNEFANL